MVELYSVSPKILLQQGISELEFTVYRFRKIVRKSDFSEQFKKPIIVNPIIVDGYASLFICTTAVRASDSMRPLRNTLTSGLGLDDLSLAWPAVVQLLVFIFSGTQ